MTAAQLDVLLAESCSSRTLWRRSARGNLTRRVGNLHATVFRRFGSWRWAITEAETDEVRYSPRGYSSEEAAADAVLAAAREG